MFNMWKPFPKYKPKENGWYQCSIRYGDSPGQSYVMDLYWYSEKEFWRDNRVVHLMCELYDVYGDNQKLIRGETVGVRNDVIAFKKLPKIYK